MTTPPPAKIAHLAFINARSYRVADFALHPGLNVVVGPSDSGKTNIVRNARSLVQNGSLESIRTSGVPEKTVATIGLDTCDGQRFGLSRSESVNKCDWEGPLQRAVGRDNDVIEEIPRDEWTSIGGSTPQAFRNKLNLSPIDLSGVEADIHFSDQRDPLFVVDDPPSKVAKIVGAVSGLDVLYRAVAAGDKQRRTAAASASAHEKIVAQAVTDLVLAEDNYNRLLPLHDAVVNAEAVRDEADARAHDTRVALSTYNAARDKARNLKAASEGLNAALSAVRDLNDHAQQLLAASDSFRSALSAHTTAKDANDAAQARLTTATESCLNLTRSLAGTLVPCPTCGTKVDALALAGPAQ